MRVSDVAIGCAIPVVQFLCVWINREERRFEIVSFDSLDDDNDKTPPVMGNIELSQINNTFFRLEMSGFIEEESEIYEVQVRLTTMISSTESEEVFYESFPPTGTFEGAVDIIPLHNMKVKACLEVFNTASLSSKGCGDPISWDAAPPVMKALHVYVPGMAAAGHPNPFVGPPSYTCATGEKTWVKPCPSNWTAIDSAAKRFVMRDCKPPVRRYRYARFETCVDTMIPINETNHIHFKMNINEIGFATRQITAIQWGISSELLTQPDETFEEVGGGQAAEFPGDSDDALGAEIEVESNDVFVDRLVHGTTVFICVWLCDAYGNCGMSYGYPLLIDHTPPPLPEYVMADYKLNTSANGVDHYLVDEVRCSARYAAYAL